MTYDEIQRANKLIFERLAILLNNKPDFVSKDMVDELVNGFSLSVEESFSLLLCAALGFDTENENDFKLWESYSPHMIHHLDENDFTKDEYYSSVKLNNGKTCGEWELREDIIAPFTVFVCNDPMTLLDGRVIPQIGYFDTEYRCLSVLQNGREWMTMMPNELVTQRLPISKAREKVATYGLGLGYFAIKCALKNTVSKVTVVERDESVINLFNELILPNFDIKDKIEIIRADAFEFAEKEAPKRNYDYIFADIWHDPSDGVWMYQRFKELEHLCPNTEFDYWIEKTLKLYM